MAMQQATERVPAMGLHASELDTQYLPARKVLERYQISDMSLWRWVHDERMKFPQPIYLGRFRYWKLNELTAWERAKAAEGRAVA